MKKTMHDFALAGGRSARPNADLSAVAGVPDRAAILLERSDCVDSALAVHQRPSPRVVDVEQQLAPIDFVDTCLPEPRVLWQPCDARRAQARITQFEAWLAARRGIRFDTYEDLWRWSTGSPSEFWSAVWEHFEIPASRSYHQVMSDAPMPRTRWFAGARLNVVDMVLRHAGRSGPALIFESEAGGTGEMSWSQLEHDVAALAHTLKGLGVRPGDRVLGYMPNIAQTVVAFLATAAVGAVWTVCALDVGATGVVGRWQQVEPVVLIACDGYRYGGRSFDRRGAVDEVLRGLESVRAVVWVAHLDAEAAPPPAAVRLEVVPWSTAVSHDVPLQTEQVASDHPLWILYSSGTTGLPKAIAHGHGGIAVNSQVLTALHGDLSSGDRCFWHTSPSWMVWNVQVMSLMVGASLLLYDGSPAGAGPEADWGTLWRFADRSGAHYFGAEAEFYATCMTEGLKPSALAGLTALKTVASTGAPLSPQCAAWVYNSVKAGIWLVCSSGGTEIAGIFIGGVPTLPVRSGEMQCRALGASVDVFDDRGRSVQGGAGELVCKKSMPSMPLHIWGDAGATRYLETYLDVCSDVDGNAVWRHGDWLRLTPHTSAVGCIIDGRSDATIIRAGLRIGTAEFDRIVGECPGIVDSLVVDLEYVAHTSYMILFVKLERGRRLDPALEARVRARLHAQLSIECIPDEIVQVEQIPRSRNGKKLEMPVKRLLLGYSLAEVADLDFVVNPESIDWFARFALQYLRR